ncbi:MAG: hypothetical protein ACLTDC_07340 [Lachnospiraceae bacterium]
MSGKCGFLRKSETLPGMISSQNRSANGGTAPESRKYADIAGDMGTSIGTGLKLGILTLLGVDVVGHFE